MAIQSKAKANISYFIVMGDSLSDRGTLERRKLLGFIPMGWLTGLDKESPKGRFTNGLTWDDDLSATMANKFTIHSLKKEYGMGSRDISEGVINGDPRVKNVLQNNYNLDDDRRVKYKGKDMVRNYSEGGLTSHSYRGAPSYSIPRFFSRLILSTLGKMRQKLFADDKAQNISAKQKTETLVMEWSGANDLMTVNSMPSKIEADRAVKDRIKNAEEMIKNGYKHFVLFNLPDLSLTPRYQAKSAAEQKNASECCAYFNQELAKAAKKLNEQYPGSSVDVFDVASTFTEVYNNPEQHGFDKDKLTKPYVKSKDFKAKANGTSPADGYMFWDDVHPSADMHAILENLLYSKYHSQFHFTASGTEHAHSQSAPALTTRQPIHGVLDDWVVVPRMLTRTAC
jgi:phospholipase/lecithinase/hemolysin